MRMIHTCLRVLDLKRSVQFYGQAFSLREHARYEFEDFVLVYMRDESNQFELELTQNIGREEPYDLGQGYGHLAVLADNLEAAQQAVREAGGLAGEIKSLQHEGALLGRFFFATDPDGYKVEVLANEGRFSS